MSAAKTIAGIALAFGLSLLANVPHAAAGDRFDVIVTATQVDARSRQQDVLVATIPGVGTKTLTVYPGGRITFRNFKEPNKDQIILKYYANYGTPQQQLTGRILSDLMEQADDARNDVATQTLILGPRARQVRLHVQVVEVD